MVVRFAHQPRLIGGACVSFLRWSYRYNAIRTHSDCVIRHAADIECPHPRCSAAHPAARRVTSASMECLYAVSSSRGCAAVRRPACSAREHAYGCGGLQLPGVTAHVGTSFIETSKKLRLFLFNRLSFYSVLYHSCFTCHAQRTSISPRDPMSHPSPCHTDEL